MQEPIYVTDKETLNIISSNKTNKSYVFLKFYLSQKKDKLFIYKKHLLELINEREAWTNLAESLRQDAVGKLRGIANEYGENNTDDDTRDETIKIVERNYATVKNLIVINPDKYKGKIRNFADKDILMPEKFMYELEIKGKYNDIIKEFNAFWEKLNKSQT